MSYKKETKTAEKKRKQQKITVFKQEIENTIEIDSNVGEILDNDM